MAQKRASDLEIKRIQGTVLAMRTSASTFVNKQLHAYKEAIEEDLVRASFFEYKNMHFNILKIFQRKTTYAVNNKQTINLKCLNKINVSEALNDSRARNPQDLMAKVSACIFVLSILF